MPGDAAMALGKPSEGGSLLQNQSPIVLRLDATEADLIRQEIVTAQPKHSLGDAEGLTCCYRNSCHTRSVLVPQGDPLTRVC